MKRIRVRITYANVVATLALFLVVAGGTALAARHMLPKNSVGTRQIKNNAITAAKIKNGTVTGKKINLPSLGAVANATHAVNADHALRADSATTATSASTAGRADSAGDASTLQGSAASAFMQGGGRFIAAHRELTVGDADVTLMNLPGIGPLTASCQMGTTYPRGGFKVFNHSGSTLDQTNHYGEGIDGGTIANGESIGFGGQEYVDAVTVQVATRSTPSVVANLNLSFLKNGNTGCEIYGQAMVGNGS
jgi:hypothetical protein